MKKIIFAVLMLNISISAMADTVSQTATGIAIDTEWKQQVYQYAKKM